MGPRVGLDCQKKKKKGTEESEINTSNNGMEIRHRSMCWLAVQGVVWKWITKCLKLHPPKIRAV